MDIHNIFSRICRGPDNYRWFCSFFGTHLTDNEFWLCGMCMLGKVVSIWTRLWPCPVLMLQIFGGVGIACLPLSMIFSFLRRPKAIITRSQYIKVNTFIVYIHFVAIYFKKWQYLNWWWALATFIHWLEFQRRAVLTLSHLRFQSRTTTCMFIWCALFLVKTYFHVQEATELGKRARDVREVALALQREERSGKKGRKWRKNVKAVQQVACTLWLYKEFLLAELEVLEPPHSYLFLMFLYSGLGTHAFRRWCQSFGRSLSPGREGSLCWQNKIILCLNLHFLSPCNLASCAGRYLLGFDCARVSCKLCAGNHRVRLLRTGFGYIHTYCNLDWACCAIDFQSFWFCAD